MGNLISIFTASNGSKRLIAIIMMGAGIVATLTGIQLPDNLQDVLVKIVEVVGLALGAWGTIHAQIDKKAKEKSDKIVAAAVKTSEVIQAANEALKK